MQIKNLFQLLKSLTGWPSVHSDRFPTRICATDTHSYHLIDSKFLKNFLKLIELIIKLLFSYK